MNDVILEARGVSCRTPLGRTKPTSVHGVSAVFEEGSATCVRGPERCGKNLLVHLLGMLENPDEGEILFRGTTVSGLDPARRHELRGRHCGFLFSAPYLLPEFSVVENVAMPLFKVLHADMPEARKRTGEMLSLVGLAGMEDAAAEHLELRDQYLVSLARAMTLQPDVLLAEDAGRLLGDPELALFSETVENLCRMTGVTLVWASDREPVAGRGWRLITMADGRIVHDTLAPSLPGRLP